MLKVINELAKEGKIDMVVELTDFELKRRAEKKKQLRRRKKGILNNKKG
jgi:hypothetical protein